MTLETVGGLLAVIAIVAFAVFAFRQGGKVKSDSSGAPPPNDGG